MFKQLSRQLQIYYSLAIMIIMASSLTVSFGVALLIATIGDISSLTLITILWIAILCIITGTVLSTFIGRWILVPIMQLSDASKQVAKGDFTVRATYTGRIQDLKITFDSFNTMVSKLSTIETLRNDFVANVSHEFKTPITAIEGYLTLLQDPTITESEHAEYIDKILLNTGRLSSLIGNVLTLSKLENQSFPTTTQRFRLDEQLRQALISLETKWDAKKINIEMESDDVFITGNESLLLQVWVNLIGNAIKFSQHGGHIAVRIDTLEDEIVVTIADKGCGMSEETLLHVFDKFYQGDTSHNAEGNGLGLTLVKKIVEIHNGSITVSSAVGEGAEFVVRLPTN